MKIFIFAFFLLACSFVAPFVSQAQEGHNFPVLVEMFSSQNCPACPPADAYMEVLSQSKGVIALSCHIDYFGRTSAGFSKEFCTKRQAAYIKRIGRKSYFTPQAMVNGHMSEIGYETEKVAANITKGRSERVNEIKIRLRGSGVYDFKIGAQKLSHKADLWMAVYDKPHKVNERGRETTYYNVVKNYIPLGQWGGSEISRAIFPITNFQSAGFVIVAQDHTTGKVLAAGDFKL